MRKHLQHYGYYTGMFIIIKWFIETAHMSNSRLQSVQIKPQGYRTSSMLSSAEHEILPANKQQITDRYSCFLAQFS